MSWSMLTKRAAMQMRSLQPAFVQTFPKIIRPPKSDRLLVGFIMYTGDMNRQAMPVLKSARDALLKFAEVTTRMDVIVKAAQARFEQLPESDWGSYVDLIREHIFATVPADPLDFGSGLTFTHVASTMATKLATELYQTALGVRLEA